MQPVSRDIDKMTADQLIERYFPSVCAHARGQFESLESLYRDWNAKINVISRRDIDNLYEHHVLHSLAIARLLGDVDSDTTFLDLGTGGGFPGIPLAIMYPQCRFLLIDRIAKKLRVAADVAAQIGLDNVEFMHGDSGECHRRFTYVVSRAVMPLDRLVKACARNVAMSAPAANRYAPGLLCLKGGDIEAESVDVARPVIEIPLQEFFSEDFFETKKLVYVPFV